MTMRWDCIFLHLRKNIAHYLSLVILSHVQELGPADQVIQVVFELVIFRQAPKIAVLHCDEVIRSSLPYTNHDLLRGIWISDFFFKKWPSFE